MLRTTAAQARRRLGHRRATRRSSPAPTAPPSRSAWPARASGSRATRARRCSSSTPTTRASRSAGASPPSTACFVGGHCRGRACASCAVAADAVLGEVGRGLPLRAGAARPGAAHALHALARARAPCARHRPRPRRGARGVRRAARGARDGAGADRRLGHRPRLEPRAHPPGRRGCSTRAPTARQESSVAKVHVVEAVGRVIDRAIQICGGARRLRTTCRSPAT